MLDRIKHALGRETEEDRRLLREQTPGTPEYYAAIDAAMKSAAYDDMRLRALWAGIGANTLNVYHNIGGWQVQEWIPPYDRASVPLAEWRPSERFLAHMAAEGQG